MVARITSPAQGFDIANILRDIKASADHVKACAGDIIDATIMQLNIETEEILETTTETKANVQSIHEAMSIVTKGMTAREGSTQDPGSQELAEVPR